MRADMSASKMGVRYWCSRRASRVIVPSRYLARWVAQWGVPEERLTVIYNALEPVNGVQPAAVPLQTPVKVVTVGRLVSWKRVDKVIEAVVPCHQVGLVIVGDGPERKRLQALANTLGVANRVYFAGQVSQEETKRLMAACDLFVLNSTYEGLPHVVLEAMSLGLPVVATAVGGTPEVVCDGENGRLMALGDDSVLAQVFLQLAVSPWERQRLARGAQQTLARFGFQRLVEETETVLRESAQMRETRGESQ